MDCAECLCRQDRGTAGFWCMAYTRNLDEAKKICDANVIKCNANISAPDVQRIHLEPGDVLVVKIPEMLSDSQLEHMKSKLEEYFPNNEHMIIVGDVDFQAIGKETK